MALAWVLHWGSKGTLCGDDAGMDTYIMRSSWEGCSKGRGQQVCGLLRGERFWCVQITERESLIGANMPTAWKKGIGLVGPIKEGVYS